MRQSQGRLRRLYQRPEVRGRERQGTEACADQEKSIPGEHTSGERMEQGKSSCPNRTGHRDGVGGSTAFNVWIQGPDSNGLHTVEAFYGFQDVHTLYDDCVSWDRG